MSKTFDPSKTAIENVDKILSASELSGDSETVIYIRTQLGGLRAQLLFAEDEDIAKAEFVKTLIKIRRDLYERCSMGEEYKYINLMLVEALDLETLHGYCFEPVLNPAAYKDFEHQVVNFVLKNESYSAMISKSQFREYMLFFAPYGVLNDPSLTAYELHIKIEHRLRLAFQETYSKADDPQKSSLENIFLSPMALISNEFNHKDHASFTLEKQNSLKLKWCETLLIMREKIIMRESVLADSVFADTVNTLLSEITGISIEILKNYEESSEVNRIMRFALHESRSVQDVFELMQGISQFGRLNFEKDSIEAICAKVGGVFLPFLEVSKDSSSILLSLTPLEHFLRVLSQIRRSSTLDLMKKKRIIFTQLIELSDELKSVNGVSLLANTLLSDITGVSFQLCYDEKFAEVKGEIFNIFRWVMSHYNLNLAWDIMAELMTCLDESIQYDDIKVITPRSSVTYLKAYLLSGAQDFRDAIISDDIRNEFDTFIEQYKDQSFREMDAKLMCDGFVQLCCNVLGKSPIEESHALNALKSVLSDVTGIHVSLFTQQDESPSKKGIELLEKFRSLENYQKAVVECESASTEYFKEHLQWRSIDIVQASSAELAKRIIAMLRAVSSLSATSASGEFERYAEPLMAELQELGANPKSYPDGKLKMEMCRSLFRARKNISISQMKYYPMNAFNAILRIINECLVYAIPGLGLDDVRDKELSRDISKRLTSLLQKKSYEDLLRVTSQSPVSPSDGRGSFSLPGRVPSANSPGCGFGLGEISPTRG